MSVRKPCRMGPAILGTLMVLLLSTPRPSASDPVLTAGTLPVGIRSACSRPSYVIRWVAQTRRTTLYGVRVANCPASLTWIVGVTAGQGRILLQVRHHLWVTAGLHAGYPKLVTSHLRATGDLRERQYRWVRGAYRPVSVRDYYRAQGHACGDAGQCRAGALKAAAGGHTAVAYAIWRRLGIRGMF